MSTRVRKVSTNKLDNLFARDGWTDSRDVLSCPSSSSSLKNKRISFPTIESTRELRPPKIQPPKQCSILSETTSNSSFSSANTDDEYGYYDDFVDEPIPLIEESDHSTVAKKSSTKSNSSFSTSIGSLGSKLSLNTSPLAARSILRSESSVVCLFEDHRADLACRSFERREANTKVTVCLAMAGVRIVQERFNEIAEYKLRITLDSQEFIAWKSFADFQSLGEACRIHMSKSSSSSLQGRKKVSLQNTVSAWDEVLQHRPWFRKPTGIEFIREESNLLESFIKNLLFEIPCIEMLVEFLVGAIINLADR